MQPIRDNRTAFFIQKALPAAQISVYWVTSILPVVFIPSRKQQMCVAVLTAITAVTISVVKFRVIWHSNWAPMGRFISIWPSRITGMMTVSAFLWQPGTTVVLGVLITVLLTVGIKALNGMKTTSCGHLMFPFRLVGHGVTTAWQPIRMVVRHNSLASMALC